MTKHSPKHLATILSLFGMERRMKLGLERVGAALAEVGNPQNGLRTIVVGGTNGKGSTTLLISVGLVEKGEKVLTLLSPHLQHVKERFLLNGEPINEAALSALANEYEPIATRHALSYFEFLAFLFFLWCRAERPNWVVLEVGMGGRLDATNVTNPDVSVLTNVAMDHTQYLGDSLLKIAAEKIPISRPGKPLITGILDEEVRGYVNRYCEENRIPWEEAKPADVLEVSWEGIEMLTGRERYSLNCPLKAQAANTAMALAVLKKVKPLICLDGVRSRWKKMVFPGRIETVTREPHVVLSGDHNVAGIEAMIQTMRMLPTKRLKILCGFSPDKDHLSMIAQLKALSNDLWVTVVPGLENEYSPEYQRLAPFFPNANEGVEHLVKSLEKDETLLVTGSLYLVGALRQKWFSEVRFLT